METLLPKISSSYGRQNTFKAGEAVFLFFFRKTLSELTGKILKQ